MLDNHQVLIDPEELAILEFEDMIAQGLQVSQALASVTSAYPAQASFIADYALTKVNLDLEHNTRVAELDQLFDQRVNQVATRLNAADSKLTSLIARANELGVAIDRLCSNLHIGRSVLTKLDRRLIQVETISKKFLSQLANALELNVQQLTEYLTQPARLAISAEYRSRKTPKASKAESFASALKTSVASGEIDPSTADIWLDSLEER